jgi:putative membrane protein
VSLLVFGSSLLAPSVVSGMMDPGAPTNGGPVGGIEGAVLAFLGPVAGVALVVLLGVVNGVAAMARYYDFHLRREGDDLTYERGLLQHYSGTIPLRKVQTLTMTENVLSRWLGYASLVIETAGYGPNQASGGGSQSAVPLAKRERVLSLARSLEPFEELDFERPPKRARQRYAFRYALVLLGLAGVLYAVSQTWGVQSFWYAPLGALVFVPVAAHLKWKHRGYCVGEDHVVTRNGFWVRQTKIVPYYRIQTVVSSETVFQRRRHLGTVTFDTAGSQSIAGSDAVAVDIDGAVVDDLREEAADSFLAALARRRRERRMRDQSPESTGTPAE